MPVLRYFVVMGCCLLALIFAAGWIWPNTTMPQATQTSAASTTAGSASANIVSTDTDSTNLGSLADWRRSEDRLDRKKRDQAVVYPDVATLPPTADRLQWERQLRYLPENHVYEARAEMPKTIDNKTIDKAADAQKIAEKKTPAHKHIARAQANARIAANDRQPRPNIVRNTFARNNAWDPFGLFD